MGIGITLPGFAHADPIRDHEMDYVERRFGRSRAIGAGRSSRRSCRVPPLPADLTKSFRTVCLYTPSHTKLHWDLKVISQHYVYGQLKQSITNFEFRPGARLGVEDGSPRSSTESAGRPFREALRQLEREGLVVASFGRGRAASCVKSHCVIMRTSLESAPCPRGARCRPGDRTRVERRDR